MNISTLSNYLRDKRNFKKIGLLLFGFVFLIMIINHYRNEYYWTHNKPLNNRRVEKWVKVLLWEQDKMDIDFKLGEKFRPSNDLLLDYFENNPDYFKRYNRSSDLIYGILLGEKAYFIDSFFYFKTYLKNGGMKALALSQASEILYWTNSKISSKDYSTNIAGEALFLATKDFPGPYTFEQQNIFFLIGAFGNFNKDLALRYNKDFIEYELQANHSGREEITSLKSKINRIDESQYMTDFHIKNILFIPYVSPVTVKETFPSDNQLNPYQIDYLIAYWAKYQIKDYTKAAYYADMRDPLFLPEPDENFIPEQSRAYHPSMRIVNQIKAYRGAGRYDDALKIYNQYGNLIDTKVNNFEQVALEIGACYAALGDYDTALEYLKKEMDNTELKNADRPIFVREGAENITMPVDDNKGVILYSIYRLALDLPEYDVFFTIGRGKEMIRIVKDALAEYQRNPIMPADWDRGYDPEIYGRLEELLSQK